MKKLFRILIILSIAVLFVSCIKKVTTTGAREKLSTHLYEKYGEEFEIEYIGRRSDGKEVWYEAEIYPKKYNGTGREYDKYYHRKGFVDIKKGIIGEELGEAGDTYAYVKLNESASEFYKEKLEELFGKNYLSVFDIYSYYIESDFEKLIKNEKKFKKSQIKGGIYIFGRVENDEDREWYRTQIYEFIQFMKETGTFEYVDMGILVLDERVLTKEFQENSKIKLKLVKEGEKYWEKNREFFVNEIRKNIMSELSENLTPYIKLEKINRTRIKNSLKWSYYNNLLTVSLYSPKYIKVNNLDKYADIKIKNYNNLSDLKFMDEEN